MKTYAVVFAPEAEEDLLSIYDYIADHGSPAIAAKYTDAIVAYCEGLSSSHTAEPSATTCDLACASRTASAAQ